MLGHQEGMACFQEWLGKFGLSASLKVERFAYRDAAGGKQREIRRETDLDGEARFRDSRWR